MFGRINVAFLALQSLQSLHTHTNSRNQPQPRRLHDSSCSYAGRYGFMSIAEFVASVQQAKLVAEANGPGATQASVFVLEDG